MKKSRKLIAILATVALLAALLVPMATPAAAADPVSFLYTTGLVDKGKADAQSMGFVKLNNFEKCDEVYFTITLPTGVEYANDPSSVSWSTYGTDYVKFYNPAASPPGYQNVTFLSGDKSKLTVKVDSADLFKEDSYVIFTFNKTGKSGVKVSSSAADSINVNVNVKGVFLGSKVWEASKDVTVAVTGKKKVTVTAGSPKSVKVGTDKAIAKVTIQESAKGAINSATDWITLTLPSDDFAWGTLPATPINGSYGLKVDKLTVDGRDLKIEFDGTSSPFGDKIELSLKINVNPGAPDGDVVLNVSSSLDVAELEADELVVAKVGETDVTVSVLNTSDDTIYQADYGKKIDAIELKASGTFTDEATITLTLPDGIKWYMNSSNFPSTTGVKFVGTYNSNQSMWLTVDGSPDTITLKDLLVATLPSAEVGDITVTFGGTAGATGSVVVGSVVAPITVTANKTNVQLAALDQAAGEITITETKKKALVNGKQIELVLPTGVTWAKKPTVKVNGTKITVDAIDSSTPDTVTFKVDKVNDGKIDTIVVSDIKFDLDTRVRTGDIMVEVKGNAVNRLDSAGDTIVKDLQADYAGKAVAKVANAVVVSATKRDASFVIGSLTYTVNGVEKAMDAAPYIKDGRTYLPVRFVADALGVDSSNILWDGKNVTLIKGDRVVQMTIGSKVMLINGASITMDVAPEVVEPGRTMLPFRWIAQALGAQVGWDEATKTVTMNIQ